MQTTLKLIATIAPLLLTACSEGGGSGSILGDLLAGNAGANSASGVEAAGSTPVDVPQQDFVMSLDDLIGTVNLTYRFNLTEGEYFNQFTFSAESRLVTEDGSNALVTGDADKEYYCQTLFTAAYLCVILTRESQVLETYLFSLGSNGQGSGTYEFCFSDEDPEACGEDLARDPDGTVDVIVNTAIAARSVVASDTSNISVDALSHKLISDQADSPYYSAPATEADKVLADEISQAIKRVTAVR